MEPPQDGVSICADTAAAAKKAVKRVESVAIFVCACIDCINFSHAGRTQKTSLKPIESSKGIENRSQILAARGHDPILLNTSTPLSRPGLKACCSPIVEPAPLRPAGKRLLIAAGRMYQLPALSAAGTLIGNRVTMGSMVLHRACLMTHRTSRLPFSAHPVADEGSRWRSSYQEHYSKRYCYLLL